MDITPDEFLTLQADADARLVERGRAPGPTYGGSDPFPLLWGDQIFAAGVTPTGTLDVFSFTPLRVGSTQNGLDLIIIASQTNSDTLTCPAGSSITVEPYLAKTASVDDCDEAFTTSGESVTVTVTETRTVEPGQQIARIHLGNLRKAWMLPKLTFTGVFVGGTVDVGLAYSPR